MLIRARFTTLAVSLAAIGHGAVFAQASALDTMDAPAMMLAQAPATFSLPAGPLETALTTLARQAGVTLAFDPALVRGKTTAAINQTGSLAEVLQRVLRPHALEALATSAGSFTVRQSVTQRSSSTGSNPRTGASAEADSQLPTVTVTAAPVVSPTDLPKPFAGGQVGRGSQLGVLGNRDFRETPFSTSSYTSQLAEEQQARSLADVVANDPSVTSVYNRFQGLDTFTIRGFTVDRANFQFNGLYGLSPVGQNLVFGLERVEVLRGPSALLGGANAAVGGTVNLVPKRAPNEGISRLTVGFQSESTTYLHADVGRRFGASKEWGVRVNALYRDGATPISGQKETVPAATIGVDYRSERLKFSLDAGYQDSLIRPQSRALVFDPSIGVPRAPDAGQGRQQPFERLAIQDNFFTTRVEYELTPAISAYASYGQRRDRQEIFVSASRIINAAGDMTQFVLDAPRDSVVRVAEVGLRGRLQIGSVDNRWALSMSDFDALQGFNFVGYNTLNSNIYSPSFFAPPVRQQATGSRTNTQFRSIVFANTFSMLEDRLQVTVGARQQTIGTKDPDNAAADRYKESALTPALAASYRLSKTTSVYGNYIEALEQGPTAPVTASNPGQVFAPTRAKQLEAGVKAEIGALGLQAAVFEIERARGELDPISNRFGITGQEKSRGAEFLAFGQPTSNLRVVGGVTFIDATFARTVDPTLQGRVVPGAAPRRLTASAFYSIPEVPGLSVNGRVTYASEQVVNTGNTQKIPAWTRMDVGASYRTAALGRPLVLRAALENVLNKNQWVATDGFGAVALGAPRTVLLSATMDF